ncbi:MAG: hypothetical protein HN353_13975 [Bdellovibrionales bacterium]|nr:hypothetical protein [Bdellovibrionales bacterium]MBT3526963.1 hypothetical protein [Bdellovibrionales bacterium]MBT7669935.1 hypothetical protein [Bdellovibrionales bacterium]MBT7766185.1 hypothetical protein [Bdellovibrionales bacterium]
MKLTTTTLILGVLVYIQIIAGPSCWASETNIVCLTERIDKKFVIQKKGIVIYNYRGDDHAGRQIASTTTSGQGNGLNKMIHFEGNRYLLHIENRNHFNSIDDFISIRSSKGHEIIYPVDCHREK